MIENKSIRALALLVAFTLICFNSVSAVTSGEYEGRRTIDPMEDEDGLDKKDENSTGPALEVDTENEKDSVRAYPPKAKDNWRWLYGGERKLLEDNLSEGDGILADGGWWTDGYAHDNDYTHDNIPLKEGANRTYTYSEEGSGAYLEPHLRNGKQHEPNGSCDNEIHEFNYTSFSSDPVKVSVNLSSDGSTVTVYIDGQQHDSPVDVSSYTDVYFSMYEWAGDTGQSSLRLTNVTDDGDWRELSEAGIGLEDPGGVWYGATTLDLSDDLGKGITEVAYYDFDSANYTKAHVAADDGGAPGQWLASSSNYTPSGAGWVELDLNGSVPVESPGDYWIVLEVEDPGTGNHPFGCVDPPVIDGQHINTGDPHDSNYWNTLPDYDLNYSWSLDAKVGGSAELVLNNWTWSVDPKTVPPGENVTIEGEVENVGGSMTSDYIDLYVDDMSSYVDSQYVSLVPGETTTVSFNHSETETGVHDVKVDVWSYSDYWLSDFEVVEPNYNVSVTPPGDKTEGSSGTYTYYYDVENTGDTEDTYDLSASSSNTDWSASSQSSSVTIPSGDISSVAVDVTIPTTAQGGDSSDITLTATSQSNTSVSDSGTMTVTLQGSYGVSVSAPSDSTETSTGTYTYSFTVSNTGNTQDTYDLSASSSNTDWSASSQSSSVTISAGGSSSVNVDVTIPTTAQGGDSSDITLTATSQSDATVSDSGTMTVTLNEDYSVSVTAPADSTESYSGTFTYSFQVENTGSGEDTYDLNTVVQLTGWSAYAQQSSITVSAGNNKTVDVEVTIPEGAGGTSCDITLEASSQNDTTVSDSDLMTVTLQENFGVVVYAPTDKTESSPGTHTYTYQLENTGNTEDAYDLSANADQTAWSATSQLQTITVGVGVTETVNVDVDIPDGAGGETCNISLTATSQNSGISDSDSMMLELTKAKYFDFANISSPQIAGVPFTLTITAHDGHDDLAEGYQGTAQLNDDTGTIEPASVDFSDGTWSGNVTITDTSPEVYIEAVDGSITGTSNGLEVLSTELNIISPAEGELVSRSDVMLEWTSENADRHEVRLDDEGWMDVGTDEEHQFTGLADGEHTAEVKAVVGTGDGKVHIINFTVDTSPPILNVTSPGKGETVYTDQMMVEWESSDEVSGIDNNEIRLNSGAWENVGDDNSYSFDDLGSGNHTVEVRTNDQAGHSTTKSRSFRVELVSVEILSPGEEEKVNNSEVRFEWNSEYAEMHEIRFDGSNWYDVGEETSHVNELEDGNHTVEVRAKDEVGNLANDEVNFLVDTSQPELEVLAPGLGAVLNETEVLIRWNGSDELSGIEDYELKVDGGLAFKGPSQEYGLEDLDEGQHEVELTATDQAGNKNIEIFTFTIDTTDPEVEIITPGEGDVLHKDVIKVEWDGSDEVSGIDSQMIRLDDGEWISVAPSNTSHTFEDLELGGHTVEIQVEDMAGNVETSLVGYSVELPDPSLIVHSMETEGGGGESPQDVVMTAEVENVAFIEMTVSIMVDGEEVETINIDPEETRTITYNHTFEEPGDHDIEIVEESRTVTVKDSSIFSSLSGFWWIFLLLGLLILIPIILLLRRREEEEEEEDLSELEISGEESEFVQESSRPVEQERVEEVKEEETPPPSTEEVEEAEETEEDESIFAEEIEEESPAEETEEIEKEESPPPPSEEESGPYTEESAVEEEVPEPEGMESEEETTGSELEEEAVGAGAPIPSESEEEDEDFLLEEDGFYECDECGFMLTEEQDVCPYCDTPINEEAREQEVEEETQEEPSEGPDEEEEVPAEPEEEPIEEPTEGLDEEEKVPAEPEEEPSEEPTESPEEEEVSSEPQEESSEEPTEDSDDEAETKYIECPLCGSENKAGSDKCFACGKDLTED